MATIDKLERQMSLLAALLHTEVALTATELHRRVEGYPEDKVAFRRAFERDKDDLRRLGIPIAIESRETVDGPVDGYVIRETDYYLHDLGLDADETVALAMALRLIRLEGADADDAIWKLGGAAFDDTAPAEIGAIAMGPAVTQLHQAIQRSLSVQFGYRGEDRVVEPWRLAFRRGHWYLSGHDVARNDARSFRLDRIDGSITLDTDRPATAARPPISAERQPWEFGSDEDETIRARVAIDASHADWARHQLGADAVVATADDGSIEIELDVVNIVGFRNLVLGMLDAAEVLSPPELRADIISWLQGQVA
jgi:proteasome accessory factor B